MVVLELLQSETLAFHAEFDADAQHLLGNVKPGDYRRFLARCYGFVGPVELAINATPRLDQMIDLRRFTKQDLLRRDLQAFRMSPAEIDQLPRCTVPAFDTPEEALGWAFVVERSTLRHTNLFRHLAMLMPGEVAFASSYLKCYFGAVGEMWRGFSRALDALEHDQAKIHRVADSARTAFRSYRNWRYRVDRARRSSESGELQSM